MAQCLIAHKLHTQTMLPTNHWEMTSSQQTGILHTKKGILKQPLYREPFVLRFHPEGGSFTQQPRGEYGCLKGLSYTQDVYTAKNTLEQYTAENTPTHYGEFTAQECGRIAEFLARVYDPYVIQHFVAYRDEDLIQYYLSALQDISPISLLSELVVCHKSLPLEPTSRFQDCNLPQEPSLHVRFRSQSDAYSFQEPVVPEPIPKAGNSSGEAWKPSPLAKGSSANPGSELWPRRHCDEPLVQSLPNLCSGPPGENPRLTLPTHRFHRHKSSALLLTAPPPTLCGSVYYVWNPCSSGRLHRNREWTPP